MKKHNVYDGSKVHVRRHQCSTCVFGQNSPVSTERRDGMVADCGDEGVIPCHHHLYAGQKVHPVCRGFYNLRQNWILRLATAMEIIEWHEEDPHEHAQEAR